MEAFATIEGITGKKQKYTYVDQNRMGDHICYYSDLSKMRAQYPKWNITQTLQSTIEQIAKAWKKRVC